MARKDKVGRRFGELLILAYDDWTRKYTVRCDCGTEVLYPGRTTFNLIVNPCCPGCQAEDRGQSRERALRGRIPPSLESK
jgi:hypothetical protein